MLSDNFTPSGGNSEDFCDCAHLQVEQVRLLDRFSNKSTHGTLYLTATHLIFVESSSNNTPAGAQEIWVSPPTSMLDCFIGYKCTQGLNTLHKIAAVYATVEMAVLHNVAVAAFHVLLKAAIEFLPQSSDDKRK